MLLGFTTGRESVLLGEKRITIRVVRKRKSPEPQETLHLYWRLRQKDCELLFRSKCNLVIEGTWKQIQTLPNIAALDGFDSHEGFLDFFNLQHDLTDDTRMVVIGWEFPPTGERGPALR